MDACSSCSGRAGGSALSAVYLTMCFFGGCRICTSKVWVSFALPRRYSGPMLWFVHVSHIYSLSLVWQERKIVSLWGCITFSSRFRTEALFSPDDYGTRPTGLFMAFVWVFARFRRPILGQHN
ncbi:unnamed protein product [Sphacelaria rigidula]